MSAYYLYRCYDADGLLLYIGCSDKPNRRATYHRNAHGHALASKLLSRHMAKFEADATPYPSRQAGLQAEAEAIYAEQPLFNIQGRCLPSDFVRHQIADYEAGEPIPRWGGPIFQSPRVQHVELVVA